MDIINVDCNDMISFQCVSNGILQDISADQNICQMFALHGYGFSPYVYTLVFFYHSLIPYKCVTLAANICFPISMLSMMFTRFFFGEKTMAIVTFLLGMNLISYTQT